MESYRAFAVRTIILMFAIGMMSYGGASWGSYYSPSPPTRSLGDMDETYRVRVESYTRYMLDWEPGKGSRLSMPTAQALTFVGIALGVALFVGIVNGEI